MNANVWQRLSDLVYARMDHLGLTQTDLEKAGGPSSAWVRKLKGGKGKPSTRHARSLRQLSTALGWDEGTAWSLLTDDRSQWSQAVLDSEEHDLVFGPTVRQSSVGESGGRPAQVVRALTRMFQSDDPIQGLTDEEWDELLEAIERRRPPREQGDPQRNASGQ